MTDRARRGELREREPLRGEERRRYCRVDVHDGKGRARLEHGSESRFPTPSSTVAHRRRDPDHGGGNEARDDRRKRTFPSGEDEVHLGMTGLDPVNDGEEPVEPRHADVVGPNDPYSKLSKEAGGFLGERHIARPGRDEGDHARAILGAERAREAD